MHVHLIFNFFQEPDVHALQIALFFQQLYKILPESSKHTTPWVVCGDFNMHPDFPVYEMLRNGKLYAESIEKLNPVKWKHPDLTRQNEIVNYDSIVLRKHKKSLTHPFRDAKSAYKSVLGNEPTFTHYECSEDFAKELGSKFLIDTLDYIWYSSKSLQVNAVLEMVKEGLIKPYCACPNEVFPSDHLSLKAFLQFPERTI
ncbi:glucose-repressible alcohol dehydrogenase transcriptional effector-like isoform X2 [Dendronephthya gigantea]|uniref:glucose-repressible alcohol dehydrogenase transcriptional effector-like isoform X2 n=1 Tax=Dendronephthya gigantea TaxID=151771 RepID=UPI00106C392B|nr:glucose-repressible alcohol dehydrogenase transcriptional effector-like isoform X2 [Dendronephthya gigantea]